MDTHLTSSKLHWYGEFKDASLEKKYFQDEVRSAIPIMRIAIFIVGLLYLMLSVFDYRTLIPFTVGHVVLSTRFAVFLMGGFIFIRAKNLKNPVTLVSLCVTIACVAYFSYVAVIFTAGSPNYYIQVLSILVMLISLFLIPGKPRMLIALALMYALVFFGLYPIVFPIDNTLEFWAPAALCFFIIVVSSMTAIRVCTARRHQYFNNLKLEALAKDLEQQVHHRTEDLQKKTEEANDAMQRAMDANSSKSEFLSRMSHEMRTPMNAIIGMTQIAENTRDIKKMRYCLDHIKASSGHLLGIINDILDMSKIEAGKLELDQSPLNVEKMLMKVCNLVIDRTEQKNQQFKVHLGKNMHVHYIGDELRLSQVLTNLLSNAVKFTPEKGSVILNVETVCESEDSHILRFSVCDTGIGMTEEQISRLFTSFEQADGSITRRFGGTGLGLAISKNIVEKMGGSIQVESRVGEGSTFIVEVTLQRDIRRDSTVIYSQISPSDLNVLVVDADEDIRNYFRCITETIGIQHTDDAPTGASALHKVSRASEQNKPYDIIFLDYTLPDMDGLETARQLGAHIDKNTVIIMTSFVGWNRIEEQANGIGIVNYISKPLFPSSVIDSINHVIGYTLKKLEIQTQPQKQSYDFSGLRVLLVEDMDINREIFAALVEDTHLQIDMAVNGLDAVQKVTNGIDLYDLIFMDIQMPEMNGYEATRAIRALDNAKARSIPIVAMSANVFVEDINRCLECGMNDHLAKPVDIDAVFEKIVHYTGAQAH